MMRFRCVWLLISSLLWFSGCDSGQARLYPVQGKVSGGTGPLKGLRITFNPVDPNGLGSSGVLGEDGSYSLESFDGRSGATVGKHKVSFALGSDAMQAAMKGMAPKGMPSGVGGPGSVVAANPGMNFSLPVPQSYSSPATSPKEVEVKAVGNVIDISL